MSSVFKNCGTGAGGFQEGNTCGKGSGSIEDKSGKSWRVEYETKEKDGETKHIYRVIDPATGLSAGGAETSWNKNRIMSVGIHPEYRRRGIASALYDHIERHIGKLEQNWATTPDGQALWDSRNKKSINKSVRILPHEAHLAASIRDNDPDLRRDRIVAATAEVAADVAAYVAGRLGYERFESPEVASAIRQLAHDVADRAIAYLDANPDADPDAVAVYQYVRTQAMAGDLMARIIQDDLEAGRVDRFNLPMDLVEQLESVHKSKRFLYHGTNKKNLSKILEEGLTPGKGENDLYFTEDPEAARKYAVGSPDDVVILQVDENDIEGLQYSGNSRHGGKNYRTSTRVPGSRISVSEGCGPRNEDGKFGYDNDCGSVSKSCGPRYDALQSLNVKQVPALIVTDLDSFDEDESVKKSNCGIGPDGFEEGNDCAKGGGESLGMPPGKATRAGALKLIEALKDAGAGDYKLRGSLAVKAEGNDIDLIELPPNEEEQHRLETEYYKKREEMEGRASRGEITQDELNDWMYGDPDELPALDKTLKRFGFEATEILEFTGIEVTRYRNEETKHQIDIWRQGDQGGEPRMGTTKLKSASILKNCGIGPDGFEEGNDCAAGDGTGEAKEITLYRGGGEGTFFTDSKEEALAYAQLAADRKLLDENEELSDLVYEIMAEEGTDDITDWDAGRVREIAEANGIEIPDAAEPNVREVKLNITKPLDLSDMGSEISIHDDWNTLHKKGLVDESWDDLDEEAQYELQDEYNGKALYKLFENEGIYDRAFKMGHDVIIIEDQGLGGKTKHKTWVTSESKSLGTASERSVLKARRITRPRVTVQVDTRLREPTVLGALKVRRIWRTEEDDRVCTICDDLSDEYEDYWDDEFPDGPPAHPNCRCRLDYEYEIRQAEPVPGRRKPRKPKVIDREPIREKILDQSSVKKPKKAAPRPKPSPKDTRRWGGRKLMEMYKSLAAAGSHLPEPDLLQSVFKNCGIGPDGFEPGNDCAKGDEPGDKSKFISTREIFDRVESHPWNPEIELKFGKPKLFAIDSLIADDVELHREGVAKYEKASDVKPIELVKFEGKVYVNDGNHRLAAAKNRGRKEIWAVVSEVVGDHRSIPKSLLKSDNCGTGDGGFKEGNTCAEGDGSGGSDAKDPVVQKTVYESLAKKIENLQKQRAELQVMYKRKDSYEKFTDQEKREFFKEQLSLEINQREQSNLLRQMEMSKNLPNAVDPGAYQKAMEEVFALNEEHRAAYVKLYESRLAEGKFPNSWHIGLISAQDSPFVMNSSKVEEAQERAVRAYYGEKDSLLPTGSHRVQPDYERLPSMVIRGGEEDSEMKEFAHNAVVAVQINEQALDRMATSGEMKNRFQSGARSNVGKGNREYNSRRKEGEHARFGLDVDSTPAEARPIYGYMEHPDRLHTKGFRVGSNYGGIQVVLKPDVKSRSTMSVGDSLDDAQTFGSEAYSAASPAKWQPRYHVPGYNVRIEKLKPNLDSSLWQAEEKGSGWNFKPGYVEAQVFGGIKAPDIQEVRIPGNIAVSDKTLTKLEKKGIKVVRTPHQYSTIYYNQPWEPAKDEDDE